MGLRISTADETERKELIALIEAGDSLPEKWQSRLFPGSGRAAEIGNKTRDEASTHIFTVNTLSQPTAEPK